jgi:DNA-directed RNA polymerase
MGTQVIDDTREMSEYLRDKDYLWGILLGGLIYEICYKRLKGPAAMLRMFQELAVRANEREMFLAWKSPMTGFPVVQAYRTALSKRTKLRYGDQEIKIVVEAWEEATLNKDGAKTGAAPNIVHSFDAAHLALTVNNANYPVSVIHDSFGSHAGNMCKLFADVRITFVNFYTSDPLMNLLKQFDSEDLMPQRGNLDVTEIIGSDYAFC